MSNEPTEGQVLAGAKALAAISLSPAPEGMEAWDAYAPSSQSMFLKQSLTVLMAALNYEEPYGPNDAAFDYALTTTDEINGHGTYAAVNQFNPNPDVQRAIRRWRER